MFKKSGLPKDLSAELKRLRPEAGSVMAVGTGDGLTVVACRECLALHRAAPTEDQDEWEFIGWHLITRGGWNKRDSELRWTLADESQDKVSLSDPGDIPDAFRNRVQASIVIEQVYDAPGGGHVVLAGRRRLGDDTTIVWQVTTLGVARLSDPAVARFATDRAAELRADYDI